MATHYATNWDKTLSAVAPANQVQIAFSYYTIGAGNLLADNDVIVMCRLPAGARVVGGHLRATDLDTGTEELDIDWGWAANGVDNADEDGFGNLGVWDGDSNNDFEIGNTYWSAGPKRFSVPTNIQLDVNADAAMGGTGTIWQTLYYVVEND